jgi:DNA-binding NtrC family response regulator
VARAIHAASGRKGTFVAINCAAFASTMVEGALFGHRRGAYTGATSDEPGAFLAADGGTLFLDEIADMPLEIQPKLLRALENGEIMPLGASTSSRYDARVIAAAQQPLRALVAEHKFRDDLYARLVGVSLDTPPLRQRREDIVPLWHSFLPEPHRAYPISLDLIEALCCYDWPHNVRELRQVAERMAVLHDGEAWTLAELDAELREHLVRRRAEVHEDASAAESDDEDKRPMPREELVALLEACGGSIAEAARRARRNRKQIYRWMDQHELPRGTGRPQR